jgi:hypothetical protein
MAEEMGEQSPKPLSMLLLIIERTGTDFKQKITSSTFFSS